MKCHINYFISVALVLTLVLTGCSLFSTGKFQSPADAAATLAKYQDALAKYNQIKPDMGYDDVVRMMGKAGELITGTDDSGHQRPPNYYRWVFDGDGRYLDVGFREIGGGFLNSRFVFYSLYILPGTMARTTAPKFDQIKVGMPYDQVVSILGSPGLLTQSILFNTTINKTRGEFYGWWPEEKPEYSLCPLQMRLTLDEGLVMYIYHP
jgi:outer membrane protein assembly factor BamE (lipoprotein component of BamABCDE complex)